MKRAGGEPQDDPQQGLSRARANSTVSNELMPVLVATLPGLREVERIAQAALDRSVLPLVVDETLEPGVKYALELSAPGLTRRVTVLVELAGPPVGDAQTLALHPLGSKGAADLTAFLVLRATEGDVEIAAVDPFIGRLLGGGRYEIEAPISSGGAGLVYRARHLLLDRPIAIKVLHSELAQDPVFTAHFNGEARAASRLDHPNICRVFDFGEDDDGLRYIVMELLEGSELADIVDKEGAQPLDVIIDYVAQVCAGLSLAHERGIVHRDVKAENIVAVPTVDDDGRPTQVVKVCDFGLAMSMDLSQGEQFTNFRGACGTPAYMPPEQIRGEMLDGRADIYACGVLLYLLSTGTLPFYDPDPRRTLAMQLKVAPARPTEVNPKVDPRLEAIILRAMCKHRDGRFASARELRTALRSLREAEGPRSAPLSGRFAAGSRLAPVGPHPAGSRSAPTVSQPTSQPPTGARSALIRTDTPGAPISSRPPPDSRRVELPRGVPRLTDQASGLVEAVDGLGKAISTGAEVHPALARLLEGRARVSFLRAGAATSALLVQDSVTGTVPLHDACPATAAVVEAALARGPVVALTLREGLDAREARTLVAKLRMDPVASSNKPHAVLITDDARLGRHRPLPWLVDLAATQLAFVLAVPEPDPAVQSSEMASILQIVETPAEARTLLESSDLIGAATQTKPWDVACAIGAGISQSVCAQILATLAEELLNQSAAVPLDLLRMLARRLAKDRSRHSDELLRNLLARSIVGPDDVPPELSVERLADEYAAVMVQSPARALAPLEAALDAATYSREVGIVAEAMRILVTQGRVIAFAHIFRTLTQHASDRQHTFRAPIAARTVAALADSAFLERVALVLLKGPPASHEASQSILVIAGEPGAHALCTVRARAERLAFATRSDLDLGSRKRFAATLRMVGPAAVPAITRALQQAGPDSTEVLVIEDLLRALPEGTSDDIGPTMLRLTQHFAPQVRCAALGALTAIWGARVRPSLLSALTDEDEDVRLSALVGLQKVGGIDVEAVARLGELFGTESDEICAAAAAALQGATPPARSLAIDILTRALSAQQIPHLFGENDADVSATVVAAAARALVALDGSDGRKLVEQRAHKADGELRQRLLSVLER